MQKINFGLHLESKRVIINKTEYTGACVTG